MNKQIVSQAVTRNIRVGLVVVGTTVAALAGFSGLAGAAPVGGGGGAKANFLVSAPSIQKVSQNVTGAGMITGLVLTGTGTTTCSVTVSVTPAYENPVVVTVPVSGGKFTATASMAGDGLYATASQAAAVEQNGALASPTKVVASGPLGDSHTSSASVIDYEPVIIK